jgi:hypothetical protein
MNITLHDYNDGTGSVEITLHESDDLPTLYAALDVLFKGHTTINVSCWLADECVYCRQADGKVWYGQHAHKWGRGTLETDALRHWAA